MFLDSRAASIDFKGFFFLKVRKSKKMAIFDSWTFELAQRLGNKRKSRLFRRLLQFRHQFMCATASFIVSHCLAHKNCPLDIFYFARWSEWMRNLRANSSVPILALFLDVFGDIPSP